MRALVYCKDLRSGCCILQPWKLISLVVPQHKSILARRLPFQVAQAHTVPELKKPARYFLVPTKLKQKTCPNFNSNCNISWKKTVWDFKMTSFLSPVTSHFSKKGTQNSISHWNWPNIYLECGQTLVETNKKVATFLGFPHPPAKKNPCVS